MGETAVDQNQLDQIGEYVKSHMGQWLAESRMTPPVEYRPQDRELLERMVRVEQQLIFSNERIENLVKTMDKRFEEMYQSTDKRFENMNQRFNQVDKRFEDMNQRFNQMFWFGTSGFAFLSILITAFKFVF